ncbi:MAG TPA: hypothetical protein VF621_01825, partial [Pyrinomonadaceae bacterium]
SKLCESVRWLFSFSSKSSLPGMAESRTGRSTGSPSSCPSRVRKDESSASRWQSAFALICASLPAIVGAGTGQGVGPTCPERLARVRFSKICS